MNCNVCYETWLIHNWNSNGFGTARKICKSMEWHCSSASNAMYVYSISLQSILRCILELRRLSAKIFSYDVNKRSLPSMKIINLIFACHWRPFMYDHTIEGSFNAIQRCRNSSSLQLSACRIPPTVLSIPFNGMEEKILAEHAISFLLSAKIWTKSIWPTFRGH